MPPTDLIKKRIYASAIGPEITDEIVISLTRTAKVYEQFIAGIVVNACQIQKATSSLKGTGIAVIGTIAYPLGNLPSEIKRVQIEECIRAGAAGVAAMMKAESLLTADYKSARDDAHAIFEAAYQGNVLVGLIANLARLTSEQAMEAARIASEGSAAFITTAGFGARSRPEHLRIIREAVGTKLPIIAAGGCRTAAHAIEHLRAGADAIVTSTPFQIIEGIDEPTQL